MPLLHNKEKKPSTFKGDRKCIKAWQRSFKTYLNAKYSGARRVLTWVETLAEKPTREDLLGTQWKHIVEFNTKLYDVVVSYTELEPQTMIENMDPEQDLACWRKLVRHYDPTGRDNHINRLNGPLSWPWAKKIGGVGNTVETEAWAH